MFKPLDVETDASHVYIGPKAGRPIETAIDRATDSITVVSPYVSGAQLQQLLSKQQAGVDVTLVCHEFNDIGPGGRLDYSDLIAQTPNRNDERHTIRTYGLLTCGILAAVTTGALMAFANFWPEHFTSKLTLRAELTVAAWYLLLAVATVILWRLRTFSYEYTPRIASLCWLGPYNPFEDRDTIHAKIYVADDAAFIGSLNFTDGGMRRNIETRVDLEDADSARELAGRVRRYADTTPIRVNIQTFGSDVFNEPPNGPDSLRESLPFVS